MQGMIESDIGGGVPDVTTRVPSEALCVTPERAEVPDVPAACRDDGNIAFIITKHGMIEKSNGLTIGRQAQRTNPPGSLVEDFADRIFQAKHVPVANEVRNRQ